MKTSVIFQLIFLFFISSLQATTWNGSMDSNWSNTANWDGGMLPGPADIVFLTNEPNQPTLDIDADVFSVIVYAGVTLTINLGKTLDIDATGHTSNAFSNTGTVINNGTIIMALDHFSSSPLLININKSFTNNGTIEINQSANVNAIYVSSGATLTNSGTISVNNASFTRIYAISSTIDNNLNGTITGTNCGILLEVTSDLSNYGTIDLDMVDKTNPGIRLQGQSTFSNYFDGDFEVYNASRGIDLFQSFCSNYGDIDIHDSTNGIAGATNSVFQNFETIIINDIDEDGITNNSAFSGAGFRNSGGATITIGNCTETKIDVTNSGITINEGTIELLANNSVWAGGDFAGAGTFKNEVSGTIKGTFLISINNTEHKGTLEPGNSPGIITTSTPTFLQPFSTLEIEVAGTGGAGTATGHDQLNSAGPVGANGTLNVSLISGFVPVVGNSFVIVEGSIVNGTFSTVNFPAAPPNTQWVIEYNAGNITILLESTVPVELISFTTVKKDKNVLLEWKTASEENNEGFEIQRSKNGTGNWEKIAFVNGNGNSTVINDYSFLDRTPFSGNNYYRLMQMDFNENTEYSNIRNVQFSKETSISIFPNPVTDHQFSIKINQDFNTGTMYLYDVAGQLKHTVSLTQNNEINLADQDLAAGIYMAEIFLDHIKVQQEKIIISN